MAVTLVTPLFAEQTGTWSRGAMREYTSAYHVTVDDVDDGPETVLSSLGLSINDRYAIGNDEDTGAFLQSATPSRVPNNRLLWLVVCRWGTPNSRGGGSGSGGTNSDGEPTDDPLEFRDEWEIGWVSRSVPVERATLWTSLTEIGLTAGDFVGAMVNSAGVPFDPPSERDADVLAVRITKYVELFPSTHLPFQNSINVATLVLEYKGFLKVVEAYRGKVSFTASHQFQNDVEYWRMTYEILIDDYSEDGWRESVPDRGFEALVAEDAPDGKGGTYSAGDISAWPAGKPKTRPLDDETGNLITTPMLFDGSGQPAEPGAEPFYIKYGKYAELDFNDLGLQAPGTRPT